MEREGKKGKTRRKGVTGVERGKREKKEGWKRKELQPPGNSGLLEPPETDHRQTTDRLQILT